ETLRTEVLEMRRKMRDAHADKDEGFELKHDAGSLVDVEFIIQYLVLAHSGQHPELADNLGNVALLGIAGRLGLIPHALAEQAGDSYRLYRRLQHRQVLSGQPSRASLEEVQSARTPVIALWDQIFGSSSAETT